MKGESVPEEGQKKGKKKRDEEKQTWRRKQAMSKDERKSSWFYRESETINGENISKK